VEEGVLPQSPLDLEAEEEEEEEEERKRERERDQLSILTLLIATFRKSLIGCSTTASSSSSSSSSSSMEIGWPSNVRHVAHVTFDRFHGFLGLPVEFEPEVPRRSPSARYVLKETWGFFKIQSFLEICCCWIGAFSKRLGSEKGVLLEIFVIGLTFLFHG